MTANEKMNCNYLQIAEMHNFLRLTANLCENKKIVRNANVCKNAFQKNSKKGRKIL